MRNNIFLPNISNLNYLNFGDKSTSWGIRSNKLQVCRVMYSESSQTFKMKLFAKIVNAFKLLHIFAKYSALVFSCTFCKLCKDTCFVKHLRTAAFNSKFFFQKLFESFGRFSRAPTNKCL